MKEEEWRKYFVHRTSCGKPLYDGKGNLVAECGMDLGGFDNEFAQCSECVQKDINDAKQKLNKKKK